MLLAFPYSTPPASSIQRRGNLGPAVFGSASLRLPAPSHWDWERVIVKVHHPSNGIIHGLGLELGRRNPAAEVGWE